MRRGGVWQRSTDRGKERVSRARVRRAIRRRISRREGGGRELTPGLMGRLNKRMSMAMEEAETRSIRRRKRIPDKTPWELRESRVVC